MTCLTYKQKSYCNLRVETYFPGKRGKEKEREKMTWYCNDIENKYVE